MKSISLQILIVFLATLVFSECSNSGDLPLCVCPRIYLPVCGSDGRTYPNKCEFACQNRRLQSRGLTGIVISFEGTCAEKERFSLKEGAELDPLFSFGNLRQGFDNNLEVPQDI